MIESQFEPKNIQYKSGYGIDNDDIDYIPACMIIHGMELILRLHWVK